MNDIGNRIKNIMAAVFEMDSSTIDDDAGPGIIDKWDSLCHMSLVMALEEEFKIRFPDEMIQQLLSFKLIELSIRELYALGSDQA